MRAEIVIGTDRDSVFSARCMWYAADASENSLFYILNLDKPDIRIYFYKDSEEGKNIGEWLSKEENRNNKAVQRKALESVLPLLTVDEFLEFVEQETNVFYQKGYKDAQKDMRKALGIC